MTITPAQAAEALVARARQRHAAVEARRAALRAALPALAAKLRATYGARQILVFGSLAWGGFHTRSDVDVAVEGLSAEQLADATTDACEIMGATVELFRLDALPDAFRRRIVADGETVP